MLVVSLLIQHYCFFRILRATVSIFRSTPRSSHTLIFLYAYKCSRNLFIIAFSCERMAAEGRPHWITKHLSWAGGRRPPLADPGLILTPSFSRPVASSDPFQWPLPALIAIFALEFQLSLLRPGRHIIIKQMSLLARLWRALISSIYIYIL